MLQTLDFLRERGIVHGDVRPENVVFNSGKVAKLTGFEKARPLGSWRSISDVTFQPYQPPEVLTAVASVYVDHKVITVVP